ncbi:MAG: RnfABCDGE type electron transport complex subunit D [Clostridia bacterium]|nr:RnfABCDGE type electron transport complex subunit D [Clostridia bacterium]
MPGLHKHRKKKSTYYPDMCFAMLVLLTVSVALNGTVALMNFAVSVISAVAFDYIGCKIIKHKFKIKNCHALFIGGLTALMLPATVPLWVPVVSCAFSIFLVKTPFGSLNHAPFSSVAAGVAFMSICKPDLIFSYTSAEVGGASIAQSLSQGTPIVTAVDLINAFIGAVPGPSGMTCAVAMLGLLAVVLIRHPKSFINSLSFLLTCFVGAVILTAISADNLFSPNALRIICLRMCSGFTLCIAVFFVTEEALSPKKNLHRIFYGVMMGVVYIILNQVSSYEDAGSFAVLLTNAFWPAAEKYIFKAKKKKAEVNTVEPTESLT